MAEKGDKKQYKCLLQIFIFFIVTLFFYLGKVTERLILTQHSPYL
jgi:hypothetical protein